MPVTVPAQRWKQRNQEFRGPQLRGEFEASLNYVKPGPENKTTGLAVMAHAISPSTRVAETGGSL